MTYGLSTRAFIEDGPVAKVAEVEMLRSTARSWRLLDEARKIAAIDCALNPANDCVDAYPLAL